ncbi:MAG: serine/threonine protein kinase [Acidobacteria bacterium]|nr:serine/threonine protein kinase [Acidobacteriota bacterium]
MPLSAGDKLGPYEIVSAIGAGGMGEVYKARDTRLERFVAVKVLPDHIAAREDSRARFEREARAVASLNHPNICVLHDIGPNYMVMELIEGETLAARLSKGAIPVEQAVAFAIQIADGLDRAHRAGVTHRDVKPGNIMLTRDGVKVLDFGLAKSTPKAIAPTEATLTAALTSEGTILGTPQYMAPEQFGGQEADARSDIWAFGAVLYEMLTGRKAFEGKSYSSLVGAILATEPAPMKGKPWLERLVGRCLRKEAEERYFSMHDIVLDLRTPPQESVGAAVPRQVQLPWVLVAGVMALIAVGVSALHFTQKAPAAPSMRFQIQTPGSAPTQFLSLSPDGRMLAFLANSGDNDQLWIRPMDSI